MVHKLKSIFIKNFYDSGDIFWEFKDVNVLVGKNGAGKSTILEIIKYTARNEYNIDLFSICDGAQVKLDDGDDDENSLNVFFNNKTIKESFTVEYINKRLDELKTEFLSYENNLNNDITANETFIEKIKNILNQEDFTLKNIKTMEEKNKFKINVEYISTINMTSNSNNNIKKSDGGFASFLDYEINEELNKILLSRNQKSHRRNLINSLNRMFKDTKKTISIDDNILTIKLRNGQIINYKSLSSGERQIIYIFIKVLIALDNNAIILMDEPEISLHLSWQENLISEIRKLNNKSQIIIVTHSPAIVMNGWMDSFIDIKDIIEK